MNLSDDALRDLTAVTELKSDGEILERQFLQLKDLVIKGHLVGTFKSEGMRMSLQLWRIWWHFGRSRRRQRRQGRRDTREQ